MPRLRQAVRGPPLTRGGCGAAHGRPGARAGSVLAAISSCRDRVPRARTDRPGPARRASSTSWRASSSSRTTTASRHSRGAPRPGRPHRDRRAMAGKGSTASPGRRRPGGDGHRDARDRRAGGIAGAPGHVAARAGHCASQAAGWERAGLSLRTFARCTARARVTSAATKTTRRRPRAPRAGAW